MASRASKKLFILSAATLAVVAIGAAPVVQANIPSQLSQQINAGVLSTSVRNSSGTVVASPVFAMSAFTASTTQGTSTGTFGDNNNRITVDNPGAANAGWTLALSASGNWVSGANNYAVAGAAPSNGQLTVNPTPATLTAVVGSATGVTKGPSATFSAAASGPKTLLTADASSADVWNGYLTGVSLSQTIPAGQALGTYTISVTQTIAAN